VFGSWLIADSPCCGPGAHKERLPVAGPAERPAVASDIADRRASLVKKRNRKKATGPVIRLTIPMLAARNRPAGIGEYADSGAPIREKELGHGRLAGRAVIYSWWAVPFASQVCLCVRFKKGGEPVSPNRPGHWRAEGCGNAEVDPEGPIAGLRAGGWAPASTAVPFHRSDQGPQRLHCTIRAGSGKKRNSKVL